MEAICPVIQSVKQYLCCTIQLHKLLKSKNVQSKSDIVNMKYEYFAGYISTLTVTAGVEGDGGGGQCSFN